MTNDVFGADYQPISEIGLEFVFRVRIYFSCPSSPQYRGCPGG